MNSILIILGAIGPTEFLLVIIAIVLLFGGKKIPELMKGVGQGIKEFKKASRVDDAPEEKKEPEKLQNPQ
jgi:sec-independent protein translocase protein TatA